MQKQLLMSCACEHVTIDIKWYNFVYFTKYQLCYNHPYASSNSYTRVETNLDTTDLNSIDQQYKDDDIM